MQQCYGYILPFRCIKYYRFSFAHSCRMFPRMWLQPLFSSLYLRNKKRCNRAVSDVESLCGIIRQSLFPKNLSPPKYAIRKDRKNDTGECSSKATRVDKTNQVVKSPLLTRQRRRWRRSQGSQGQSQCEQHRQSRRQGCWRRWWSSRHQFRWAWQ